MIFFAVALGLLLHVFLWGLGAAMLAMPAPWRRFWPVLVMPAGFALQSATVWAGAMTGLRGTNSYAWAAEAIPVALLAVALWRRGGVRATWRELRRFGAVGAAMLGCLLLLVLPLAQASRGLTTVSLGSCDAADYAGGARVLMEFARTDREGFLGLAEVVSVQSVDNFFDYWLRINHFTPAALIALNGTILQCAPHELTSLMTMLLLAGSVPVVFWMARAVVRLPRRASVFVAVLYGISPITWYAIEQVAMSQLIAAQSIALLSWAGVALWRRRLTWRRGLAFGAVLLGAYWLALGSYNFIVSVCLVPAVAYAGGLALWRRQWRRFGLWLAVMLAPLAVCGVLAFERVAGLWERVTLLRAYDFGWRIPPISPEGWLAFLGNAPLLSPLATALRWVLSIALVLLVVAALRRRSQLAWRAVALAVPALIGYTYLQMRGAMLGTNASYDAYKLLAVFFPGVLAVSLIWLRWLRRGQRWRPLAIGATALLVVAHAQALSRGYRALKAPPLRVTIELRDLRKIEAMPDVKSVNMLLPDMWSRLWANAFLLKKPQYFLTHTYEARLNTPLRGEWDLQGGLLRVKPMGATIDLSPRFTLAKAAGPSSLRAQLGEGWHAEEYGPAGESWRWTRGDATVRVENPHNIAMPLVVTLDGWSLGERDLSLVDADGRATGTGHLGADRKSLRFAGGVHVPPGVSTFTIKSAQPPATAGGDPRPLAICVFEITLAPVAW
jgi:hypothetical protein